MEAYPCEYLLMPYGNAAITMYPDGSKKVVVALSRPIKYGEPRSLPRVSSIGKDVERSVRVSQKRTVSCVYDICRSNSWDWFSTLTFNPSLVDSFDYDICSAEVICFTSALRYRGLQYVIVPETHKSGAFHFHGLLAGDLSIPSDIIFSGHYDGAGREIYNFSFYDVGFSTVTKVGNSCRASGYLSKYLVKAESCVPFGRKRYWASRGLLRPEKVVLGVSDAEVAALTLSASFSKETESDYGRYLILDIPAGV